MLPTQTSFFRQTFGPLILLLLCPPTVFAFWYTNTYLEGSLFRFTEFAWQQGFLSTLKTIWFPYFFGTSIAWTMLVILASLQLILMRILPGERYEGPITPAGHVPLYKANGFSAFIVTISIFLIASYYYQLFAPTIIYDNFPGLLGALNIFSLCFCFFLVLKGHYFPSNGDVGGSGNIIFDYYWGMELYPRLLGWDIKQFTNCRFGMMSWALIVISFAAKQQQLDGLSDSMFVAVALQLIYITKFFIWEPGYLRSLDIMHDRAGYYICWGCLVWVPGIYTSPTLYLVDHPNHLGLALSSLLFVVGVIGILVNYLADRQRQLVRKNQGNCRIWGKEPILTVAKYTTQTGESKQNLLLASGWWGLSRHFHYLPELLGAFCWSAPALFENFLPYFYFVFLTILLTDRAFRDDQRCSKKYGEDWKIYCQRVPYKIIPFVI
ncbi:7-dehydrocholesterol reductase [Candidatus Protochlamydia amoebophila]|uniref:7-dehydrocholesterol reductase n=1 Tax=Protochlamydia amoebophila (strain UWE25) TaxID=264201 RepID=Q6MBV5_PARUW|nr:7-dehydrocholesterol reductase [Candidatus Protochlamydia amoebophila]CAF23944.1 unnamed protein product [Candidatus Protochlamydia amoebophila UWE25]